MKPANFPERKRQRQLRALARLVMAGEGGGDTASVLRERTATPRRDVRTKKFRGAGWRGRLT